MTVLAQPRHRLVESALNTARTWCAGRIIDERPAIAHAARVAVVADSHQPGLAPELVAAALLHDAPEFAPTSIDLEGYLTAVFGTKVARIVWELEREHRELGLLDPPIRLHDPDVLLLSTADRIVALTSLVRRSRHSGNPDAFFSSRPALLRLIPYFHACHRAATGYIPATMSADLGRILTVLDTLTADASNLHRPKS